MYRLISLVGILRKVIEKIVKQKNIYCTWKGIKIYLIDEMALIETQKHRMS